MRFVGPGKGHTEELDLRSKNIRLASMMIETNRLNAAVKSSNFSAAAYTLSRCADSMMADGGAYSVRVLQSAQANSACLLIVNPVAISDMNTCN